MFVLHVTEHEAIRGWAAASDGLLTPALLDVSASALARMEHEGVLRRVITGVYIGAQHPTHPLLEAAAWTLKHPKAVACLLTAAVHHDLTDAFARGTWLFVPFGASPPRSRVAPVHVLQVAPRLVDPDLDADMGIEPLSVHGVRVRLTSPDRTTLDLWRYHRQISREHALDALRRRVRAKDFEMPRLARLARRLDVWDKVEPVAQGLVLR